MKNIYILIVTIFLLSSCGGLKDAGKVLKKKKIKTKKKLKKKKKRPLVLPPDYQKLPRPGEIKNKENNEEENIKSILKAPKETIKENKSSSTEKSILEKIRK